MSESQEKIIKFDGMPTVEDFTAELKLFAEDNNADVIELANSSTIVIAISADEQYAVEQIMLGDEEAGNLRRATVVSRVQVNEGDILVKPSGGMLFFKEEGDPWEFSEIEQKGESKFLESFVQEILPQ